MTVNNGLQPYRGLSTIHISPINDVDISLFYLNISLYYFGNQFYKNGIIFGEKFFVACERQISHQDGNNLLLYDNFLLILKIQKTAVYLLLQYLHAMINKEEERR